MNLVTKILNSAALASAKSSESTCPAIAFDEPKMPSSMIK
ncbi:MAG: cyclic lactone autoinducer peptide [Bacilli bacterium]|nr:cyclic lactone autoinducer peptide [Bacilli bacterium]